MSQDNSEVIPTTLVGLLKEWVRDVIFETGAIQDGRRTHVRNGRQAREKMLIDALSQVAPGLFPTATRYAFELAVREFDDAGARVIVKGPVSVVTGERARQITRFNGMEFGFYQLIENRNACRLRGLTDDMVLRKLQELVPEVMERLVMNKDGVYEFTVYREPVAEPPKVKPCFRVTRAGYTDNGEVLR